MSRTPQARLQHDLRGGMNALKLCLSALAVSDDPKEAVEWLDGIDNATDKCARALDEFDRATTDPAVAGPAPPAGASV